MGGQTQSVWTSDILRLIGNTCADLGPLIIPESTSKSTKPLVDVNRERIIAKVNLDALINRLCYDEQVDLAIVVLNNLCSEYGAPLSSLYVVVAHAL